MRSLGFGQRLVPISALIAGLAFVALISAVALFAFGAYVKQIRTSCSSLIEQATADSKPGSPADASATARLFSNRFSDPAIVMTFVDSAHRVTLTRMGSGGGRVSIATRARADRSAEPAASGAFAHLVLGLATVFGYSVERARSGDLDIYAGVDEPVFAQDVRDYLPAFWIALVLALVLAVVLARVLEREAVRPLADVTAALERFAAGDFQSEPIFADGDERLGALAVAYNGAVQQVQRSFAERERANAAMRQFSADAGHQLRTPLTVVRGFISILRQSPLATEPECASILRSMAQQSAVMSSLVDKLMLLERWESATERGDVDIGECIAEVVTPLALAHPDRDVRMETAIGTKVRMDPEIFGHALSNVVDNALKYTAGAIEIRMTVTDTVVDVAIADRGPGMTQEQRARAFDRFFRGRRRDIEGSGLGLAIAKRAIEHEGGTIDLASDEVGGTTVRIVVPRS